MFERALLLGTENGFIEILANGTKNPPSKAAH